MTVPDSRPAQLDTLPPNSHRPGLILAFLCVAQFLVFLDVSIVNVALPSIQTTLSITENNLPYVVTAYGTVLGGCLLFGSRLADTFGRRRMLQIGLAIFGLASLAAGIAQEPITLLVARGVEGFGAALIAPAALSVLTTTFAEGPERNKALGIWGALTGLASVAGVILGGILSYGPGWRWVFFINIPIAIAAVALAPLVLPESKDVRERRRFDAAGVVLLTGSLLLLIYTLSEAINAGWGEPRIVGGLVIAALLMIGFIAVEKRTHHPLIPFGIFRLRSLRTANISTMFLLGCVVTVFFFASLFMQQVLDYSALKTGLAYAPLAVIVAVGAGLASGLTTKLSAKAVLTIGLILVTAGLLLLWRMPSDAGYLIDILPAFLITGLGMGMSFVPLQISAQYGVEEERAGLAAGLINTSQELGGAIGVAVAASIAFGRIAGLENAAHEDPVLVLAARTTVFHQAFLVAACFALAALLVSLAQLPRLEPSRIDK